MKDFVPYYKSFDHITRSEFIDKHTSIIAQERLPSGNPNTAILMVDGTYAFIFLKVGKIISTKPYSMYKGRFLVKPMRNVASDDYIIDSIGPYLADRRNNDAVISNKLYV